MNAYFRGEIVLVDFPFTDGSKEKQRPAIIISNSSINRTSDVLMAQITASLRKDEFSFEISDTHLSIPLKKPSEIRCHKLFTLDKTKIRKKISALEKAKQVELFEKIITFLDPDKP